MEGDDARKGEELQYLEYLLSKRCRPNMNVSGLLGSPPKHQHPTPCILEQK